jgi:predicted  nucleic acid-binding Zn-ribbon protein
VASLDAKLAELTGRQRDALERLGVAESEVDASIASLTSQRPGAVAAVPQALLTPYDRLRSRLGGVAVARLVGGRCDGCHLSLPAMELDRIRHQSAGSLETCEQCGRILVIAGH